MLLAKWQDGSAKSWYAAGTGGQGGSLGSIMAADNSAADGDAPQATDASRCLLVIPDFPSVCPFRVEVHVTENICCNDSQSWASAGTYDPEGLESGGEAAQLKQLKLTLEVHTPPRLGCYLHR
jgi:hypothetical protein